MINRPKISVVIPVFNMEPHLVESIGSVMRQTFKDLEVICIDDGSTDNSLGVLRELQLQDSRLRVFALPRNLSESQARKKGVFASQGEVVMFLDADDSFALDACDKVWAHMSQGTIDILHFGTTVINQTAFFESLVLKIQKKISPWLSLIIGDLVVACFQDERFSHTLWNKAFRGDLTRMSFNAIRDGKFPYAADLYAAFILFYYSRNYFGIPDHLLNYNYGYGISGQRVYDLLTFERFCEASRVSDAISEFISSRDDSIKYLNLVTNIRRKLLEDVFGRWLNKLAECDRDVGLDLLKKNWREEELNWLLVSHQSKYPWIKNYL
mgnify:FL=1